MEEAGKFLEDGKKANKSYFMGLCPNLKLQYKLSRAAKKKAREVVEIQGARKFESLSYRAPLRGYEALELNVNFELNYGGLKDGDDNMIGVWGMGGVGKTTLVEQVANHAKEQKLFDEVVMASVFQNPDLRKIQGQLADMLELRHWLTTSKPKFVTRNRDNAFVRMHDVVRDVALAIASKDHVFSLREGVGLEEWPKLDELQSCSKISLAYNDIRKLPEGLVMLFFNQKFSGCASQAIAVNKPPFHFKS
ncbi:hypothetical protein CK203_110689 [Vitis vinifera]|uniref:NB-ARC domain-containing protein n=1 Tax=Vitis vinifera TaxID=29760 RepID=A0A438FDU0_VITVI|nr:hypothetical protein CK203_110689 [Vitis vinifera]